MAYDLKSEGGLVACPWVQILPHPPEFKIMSEYYTMSPEMFKKFGPKGENSKNMDEEIRKVFKLPPNRYYSVTLSPSPVGRVFVDRSRTRVFESIKLSKSN